MLNYTEILNKLITNSNKKINLNANSVTRVLSVLSLLAHPQKSYKIIHIAGTNGKGSTASFINNGLIHNKHKVGMFTSPFIYKPNESILINNIPISNKDLTEVTNNIIFLSNSYRIALTPFELLTIVMFYYFHINQIEYLVLEVGLGGLYDATNVVDPILTVITNVTLEHTNFLGNNILDIVKHKTGIIKPKVPIITSSECNILTKQILQSIIKNNPTSDKLQTEKNIESYYHNVLKIYDFDTNLNFTNFTTNITINEDNFCLNLFGKFQAYNFLCAYEVLKQLNIPLKSIKHAAQNTKIAARMQLYQAQELHNLFNKNKEAVITIVDVAHNEAGVEAVYETLNQQYNREDIIIITSILSDKNIPKILQILSNLSNDIIFTEVMNTDRGTSPHLLLQIAQSSDNMPSTYHAHNLLADAITYAKHLSSESNNKKLILIIGSFYLINQLEI